MLGACYLLLFVYLLFWVLCISLSDLVCIVCVWFIIYLFLLGVAFCYFSFVFTLEVVFVLLLVAWFDCLLLLLF